LDALERLRAYHIQRSGGVFPPEDPERPKLTRKVQQQRIDCFIFFFLIAFGWGKTRPGASGPILVEHAPISGIRALGYPNRYRIEQASKRVRALCPEETSQYKQAYKEFREACRRYNATESEKAWNWYVAGKGNKNSVAYRTKVDLSRRNGVEHFRTRRSFKYMAHELLPRKEERKRARQEIKQAQETIKHSRKIK
jgi:hypothetical protein